MPDRMSATDLHRNLAEFKIGLTYYHHHLGKLRYTEGVKFLADNGRAHWLIDVIANYQIAARFAEGRIAKFQLWVLSPKANKAATLTCHQERGASAEVTQEIEFTDFLFDGDKPFELYVAVNSNGDMKTLMLPQEYQDVRTQH